MHFHICKFVFFFAIFSNLLFAQHIEFLQIQSQIFIYYSMAWSAIWQDIAQVGVSYFHKPKASENIAHERNVLPCCTTNH